MKEMYRDYCFNQLAWGDGIRRQSLCEEFGISKAHGTRLINQLYEMIGEHLEKVGHRHIAKESIREHPSFLPYREGHAFFQSLMGFSDNDRQGIQFGLKNRVFIHRPIDGHIDREIVLKISDTIRKSKALKIRYVSTQPGREAEELTVYPLRYFFVYDRWHLHAYCYERRQSRDYVMSRITGCGNQLALECPVAFKQLKVRTVKISPRPELNRDQRYCVEKEFAMNDGQAIIKMPEALLFYFKIRYLGERLPQSRRCPPDVLISAEFQ